ncbi:hypothetical protein H696_01583 [Fonticula alba]|uniref:ADF-H domain-containing protein n=1 Tax=Fonticula alba TaxID=691883 RepID=A0A058ZE01_FONAL|nr:hypothetical protein H696_01583 [Fonticula alba]KCV72181.1 hypothetical protein H696_01583 [Fonticula alba]|eukprot:XP_009493759.1 hypothetical protein H696_01583 [Fonticula alba]
MSSTDVSFESTLLDAIAAVRDDAKPNTWVIAVHPDDNPNELALHSTGEGDVQDMINNMDDSCAMHAFVRVNQQFDLSNTVKFVYIYLLGDHVPFVKRGKFGIVFGKCRGIFEPYHVDFEITKVSEITPADIEKRVAENVGRSDNILDNIDDRQVRGYTALSAHTVNTQNAAPATPAAPAGARIVKGSGPTLGTVPRGKSSEVSFSQEAIDAIKQVHDGHLTWVLCHYPGDALNNPIAVLASGNEEEPANVLAGHLNTSSLAYGLIRVVDPVDGIPTTKFAFVSVVGPSVRMMTKAKVGTHQGAVLETFHPYHVSMNLSGEPGEISHQIVMDKVQLYSGSRR